MDIATYRIQFEAQTAGVSDYFIKLLLEEEPDLEPSLVDTANMVDAAYGIESCQKTEENVEEKSPDARVEPHLITREEYLELVQNMLRIRDCNHSLSGDVEQQLRVYRYPLDEPYRLRISGGSVGEPRLVDEDVVIQLKVEDQSEILLEKPPASPVSVSWSGSVVTQQGLATGPVITADGPRLFWGQAVTGFMNLRYRSQYELYDLTVTGLGDGLPGKALVIGFCHGLVDELTIEPEPATGDWLGREKYCGRSQLKAGKDSGDSVICYERVLRKKLCQCSGAVAWSEEIEQETSCPPGVRCGPGLTDCRVYVGFREEIIDYVDCGEETADVADPAFYEQNCCHPPPWPLPKCKKVSRKNHGGQPPDPDTVAELRAIYGTDLEVVSVGPKSGDCGRTEYVQRLVPQNCCDEVETDVAIDRTTVPGTLPHGESVVIYAAGGQLPYTWSVSNSQLLVNGKTSASTDVPWVTLEATEDFCGRGTIQLTDNCSDDSVVVQSDSGVWEYIGDTCGLPGVYPDVISKYSGNSAISNGYKQYEKLEQVGWEAGWCLQFGYGDNPNAACLADLDAFIAHMDARRPANAVNDMCLGGANEQILNAQAPGSVREVYHTYDDGTILYGASLCSYSCTIPPLNTYGSTNRKFGKSLRTNTLKLYRWSC